MINDVIDGISIKLNSEFGDGYEIYSKNVEQGLNEPCFFIKSLNVINNHYLGTRKQRVYPFDVMYFPVNREDNDEMNEVAERMMESVEYIELVNGDILRATSMDYEIVDEVLHFKITFKVFLNSEKEKDFMETLTIQEGVSNG